MLMLLRLSWWRDGASAPASAGTLTSGPLPASLGDPLLPELVEPPFDVLLPPELDPPELLVLAPELPLAPELEAPDPPDDDCDPLPLEDAPDEEEGPPPVLLVPLPPLVDPEDEVLLPPFEASSPEASSAEAKSPWPGVWLLHPTAAPSASNVNGATTGND